MRRQTRAEPPKPTLKDRLDQTIAAVTGDPLKDADVDMKHVLDVLADLKPKPIETLSPQEARQQPTAADGVKALLQKEGKSTAPEPGVQAKDVTYEGATGPVKARLYTPDGASGNLPVILYFRGGGWVIASLDVYDSSARALAKQANAIVVSADYRMAPENKFPAAHDDAVAAYKWVLKSAPEWGGDAKRVALVGESAGGNLAINVAIAARDQGLQKPLHQVLVYPVAGINMDTPSYKDSEDAKPLNKAMMQWFFTHVPQSEQDKKDPRLDLIGMAKLSDLPSTTVITAQIDPLRSDGEMLAEKLKAAGVNVNARGYQGAAHEFFGMAAAVADAKDAQALAAADLKKAFAASSPGGNVGSR